MNGLLLVAMVATGAPAVAAPLASGAPPDAESFQGAPWASWSSARALDRAATSLRAESRAMGALVQALKRETRAGSLRLSTEAKLGWQRGVTAFERVEALGEVGDWRGAWEAAAAARTVAERGAGEAFTVRTSDAVKDALKGYLDAVEPRLSDAHDLLRVLGRDDLDERWWEARRVLEQAKKLVATGRYFQAWGAVVVAAGLIDQIVLAAAYAPDGVTTGGGGSSPTP